MARQNPFFQYQIISDFELFLMLSKEVPSHSLAHEGNAQWFNYRHICAGIQVLSARGKQSSDRSSQGLETLGRHACRSTRPPEVDPHCV